MCGIIGMTGGIYKFEEGILRTLFLLNAERGMHGCGVIYTYEEKNKPFYAWDVSDKPSSQYAYSKEMDDVLSTPLLNLFVGHSRHATKGEIKKANNHPFYVKKPGKDNGSILGVHNGTIHGTFKGTKDFDTDSEALYHLIATEGLKETLERVHKEATNVAYALVYYDSKEHMVYMIRNSQRPLWMVEKKFGGKVAFASEQNMLLYSIARQDKLKDWHEPRSVIPGDLISFDLQEQSYNDVQMKTEKNFFKYTPKYSYNYNNNGWPLPSKNKNETGSYDEGWRQIWKKQKDGTWKRIEDDKDSNLVTTAKNDKDLKGKVIHLPKSTDETTKQSFCGKTSNRKEKKQQKKTTNNNNNKNNTNRVHHYIKIGTHVVEENYVNEALEKGCCVCSDPEIIVNGQLDFKFLPTGTDKPYDFVCPQCLSLGEEYLEETFALTDLVEPVWFNRDTKKAVSK